MRKNEIDWIRNIGVLLLFIFHTVSIFTYYEPWYIWSQNKSWIATIIFIIFIPWHMPILFFLAGAATRFSLNNRNEKKYILERVKRLLVPFIFGMIILVPPQGYFARVSRGKTVGNYFEQWKYFWTTISDIPYDGGLGPAHLWFILYLFIISVFGILIIKTFKTEFMKKLLLKLKNIIISKYSLLFIVSLFSFADMTPLAIAEKNIFIFLIVFLMGYIVYSDDDYLNYIDKSKNKALVLSLGIIIIYIGVILYYYQHYNEAFWLQTILSILRNIIMVTVVSWMIGYGRKYLTKGGSSLNYLNKACFPIYILHQTVIVIIGNYILNYNVPIYIAFLIIIISSFIITFVLYEILKRIKIIRVLIGSK